MSMSGDVPVPLYVRLSAEPSRLLDRAAASTGLSKRRIVEDAVSDHLREGRLLVGRAALRERTPEVLTLEEAAALLRVEPDDLVSAAVAGEVPARRLGDSWRFATSALLDWLGHPNAPASS